MRSKKGEGCRVEGLRERLPPGQPRPPARPSPSEGPHPPDSRSGFMRFGFRVYGCGFGFWVYG